MTCLPRIVKSLDMYDRATFCISVSCFMTDKAGYHKVDTYINYHSACIIAFAFSN